MKKILIQIWLFGVITVCLAMSALAANKPRPSVAAVDSDQEPLQRELQESSESVDRREILKENLRPNVTSSTSWWQAGYTQAAKKWVSIEESIADGSQSTLLDEYQEQRSGLSDQPHGQWQLATWCRKHRLYDQERVHLLRVLYDRDPSVNADAVYERLGCHRVENSWVSPQEQREAARLNAEIEQSYKRWNPKIGLLIQQLGGTPKQRTSAEKQLSEITNPSAVPAIFSSFCMSTRPLAECGVKTLGQIPEYQASRALAGQAVFSPWKMVRGQATELLKRRKLSEFAPDLLLLLSNPVRLEAKAITSKNPLDSELRINWDYAWVEETQDTVRVAMGRLVPTSLPADTVQLVSLRRPWIAGFYSNGRKLNAAEVGAAAFEVFDQAESLKYQADSVNEVRVAMNEWVGTVLSDCTNEPMSSEPKDLWNWWANYSAVASPSQKAVVVVDERQSRPVVPTIRLSCLAAGTAIWTERGFRPVEQILPGDRVLSKEIGSGELSYKPVLLTTVREPTSVHKFHIEDDEIVASKGHHFWVSGEGWTKTRELLPRQPLHTATGMRRIVIVVDEGHVEKVYNLVVADFHTYFVGKSMILSHDVTTPSLTNVKVPGLVSN